ncbi:MAG: hypothetical protein Kow00107_00220 [Planctomycetota bacterium]
MKKLLVLAAFSVLVLSSVGHAEVFKVTFELEPQYRQDLNLTMSYPLFNDQLWSDGGSFEGSVRHWYVADTADRRNFLHLIMWRDSPSNVTIYQDILKPRFEKLLSQTYPDVKWGPVEVAGEPVTSSMGKTASYYRVDLRSWEMVTSTNAEGVEETKPGKSYWARIMAISDSKTNQCYFIMGTAFDEVFLSLNDSIFSKFATSIVFGKVSNAGLVIMLILGILILSGLGAGYFYMESKKAAERKRRLREVQEDHYDYYDEEDDYDDYDDYDRRGGRGRSTRTAPPARSHRGGRTAGPSRPPRRR